MGELGCSRYSLVHRPTRRIIATLPYRRACKAVAAELAALRIDWQEIDPEKVLGEGSGSREGASGYPAFRETHPHVAGSTRQHRA